MVALLGNVVPLAGLSGTVFSDSELDAILVFLVWPQCTPATLATALKVDRTDNQPAWAHWFAGEIVRSMRPGIEMRPGIWDWLGGIMSAVQRARLNRERTTRPTELGGSPAAALMGCRAMA